MGPLVKNIPSNRYSSYKDSGVDWLGEIPSTWSLTRLGTRFEERKTKVSDKDFPPLSVTKYGTIPQLDSAAKSNDGDNRKLVKTGDFVINSRSDRKGSSGIAYQDGSVSLIYIVIEPKGINPTYCNYLLKSYNFVEEFYRMGHGIVADLWTTRYDEMKAITVGIPTIDEQNAIAEFLDRKTVLIDQAIGIKQKQIELLKERRRILIHKAVTRGLNHNVKMKDSGVDWIGDIPEDWEVNKLMGVCNFIRGNSTFSKDELLNNGRYVALQYGKTYKVDEINENYNFYVNDKFYKKNQIVECDDTILVSTSETIEDLGHSAYYNRIDIGLIGGEQILLKPKKKINGHYLYFYSKIFSRELRKYATGIKVYRFNVNNLKSIYLSIPPLSEQKQIVEFLKTATAKTTIAISLKEQEIERLKEYKATLINSAVTGKIKVYNNAK